jgi:hypothetical protein
VQSAPSYDRRWPISAGTGDGVDILEREGEKAGFWQHLLFFAGVQAAERIWVSLVLSHSMPKWLPASNSQRPLNTHHSPLPPPKKRKEKKGKKNHNIRTEWHG